MLIGLGHTARVGKDTCGALLAKHHGYQVIAFADALRELVYHTDPAVRSIVDRIGWDEGKQAYPDLVRKALIDVGNHARRILGEDVWIQAAFNRIESDRAVITDVRYPNEVQAVKDHGGIVVKVTRPGCEPLPNVADQALADFDEWDGVLDNAGTVDDLRGLIDAWMELLCTPPG